MTLPPELARLDADTRDVVLALALEIVREPQPIEGLTRQQTKLVRVLQAQAGRWVSYDALAQAIQCRDRLDPVSRELVTVRLCQMRGHPMREHIETTGKGRFKEGMARWIG